MFWNSDRQDWKFDDQVRCLKQQDGLDKAIKIILKVLASIHQKSKLLLLGTLTSLWHFFKTFSWNIIMMMHMTFTMKFLLCNMLEFDWYRIFHVCWTSCSITISQTFPCSSFNHRDWVWLVKLALIIKGSLVSLLHFLKTECLKFFNKQINSSFRCYMIMTSFINQNLTWVMSLDTPKCQCTYHLLS